MLRALDEGRKAVSCCATPPPSRAVLEHYSPLKGSFPLSQAGATTAEERDQALPNSVLSSPGDSQQGSVGLLWIPPHKEKNLERGEHTEKMTARHFFFFTSPSNSPAFSQTQSASVVSCPWGPELCVESCPGHCRMLSGVPDDACLVCALL